MPENSNPALRKPPPSFEKRQRPDTLENHQNPLLRVLVVDDNPDAALVLGSMIQTLGHDVKAASNGKTALEVAGEYKPHIVFLDLGMPVINGYELCQAMRQAPDMKNTVFVVQSGWEKKANEQFSREAGFDHYLVKPVKMDALEKLFSNVIRNKI